MKSLPKCGTFGEVRFVVEPRHAIDFAEGGMPAVLSTPWLIWFLEHAAREAVLPLLDPGESTVGTEVEVRHLAQPRWGRRSHAGRASSSPTGMRFPSNWKHMTNANGSPVARTA